MDNNTLLLRQIHPAFVQQGRVTSQAFRPTPKDQNRLSVYDGDQITANNAFEHYTQQLGYSSMGVLAVTIDECNDVQLPVQPDPEPYPEHVVIEIAGLGKRDIEIRAKQLRTKAELRGWLFQAI